MKRSRVKILFFLSVIPLVAMVLSHVENLEAWSCDVAVVSAKATTNGRPLIWKSRDCSANWQQQITYFPAVNPGPGGYIMVYDYDDVALVNTGSLVNPSGGVNEAGFAISCTSVYEDFMPIHEAANINTRMIQESLEKCVTLGDYDNLLRNWVSLHRGKVISGNFVAIDAHGGAALYELYTGSSVIFYRSLQIRKFDANTGEEFDENNRRLRTKPGNYKYFENRANNNSFISINYGEERKRRAEYLFGILYDSKRLNYRTVMREIARDVVGQQLSSDFNDSNYSTTYCISRSQTRLALVVDGVPSGANPHLATFWCILGEPSIGISTPYFAYAKDTPYLSYIDGIDIYGTYYDYNDTCLMNRAINLREIYDNLLYESNYGNAVSGIDDNTINKIELAKLQQWTFPLEDIILDRTEEILDQFRSNASLVTPPNLFDVSDFTAFYGYTNYNETSPGLFYDWDINKPLGMFW